MQGLAQIQHFRTDHPDLIKEKLYLFHKRFCEREDLVCTKPRTIGRIIAEAPGKMRGFPVKGRSNRQKVLRGKLQGPVLGITCKHLHRTLDISEIRPEQGNPGLVSGGRECVDSGGGEDANDVHR